LQTKQQIDVLGFRATMGGTASDLIDGLRHELRGESPSLPIHLPPELLDALAKIPKGEPWALPLSGEVRAALAKAMSEWSPLLITGTHAVTVAELNAELARARTRVRAFGVFSPDRPPFEALEQVLKGLSTGPAASLEEVAPKNRLAWWVSALSAAPPGGCVVFEAVQHADPAALALIEEGIAALGRGRLSIVLTYRSRGEELPRGIAELPSATGDGAAELATWLSPDQPRSDLDERVAGRLESLVTGGELVRTLAAVGPKIPIDLAKEISGLSVPVFAEAISELEAARLVIVEKKSIAFSHPRLAEAVYEAMLPIERKLAHQVIAGALALTEAHPDTRAFHFARGDDPLRGIEHLMTAAERAFRLRLRRRALRWIREATEIVESSAGRGKIYDLAELWCAGMELSSIVEPELTVRFSDRLRAQVAGRPELAHMIDQFLERGAKGGPLAKRLWRERRFDPSQADAGQWAPRLVAFGSRAVLAGASQKIREAHVAKLRQMNVPPGPLRASASVAEAFFLEECGRWEELASTSREALAQQGAHLSAGLPLPNALRWEHAFTHAMLTFAEVALGTPSDAARLEQARKLSELDAAAEVRILLSTAQLARAAQQGDLRAANELAKPLEAELRALGHPPLLRARVDGWWTVLHLVRGEPEAAARWCARLEREARRAPKVAWLSRQALVHRALVELEAGSENARAAYDAAVVALTALPSHAMRCLLVSARVRNASRGADANLARELAHEALYLSNGAMVWARIEALRTFAIASSGEQAVKAAREAAALAEEAGLKLPLAWAQLAGARAETDPERARKLEADALAILEAHQAVPTLAPTSRDRFG
jgi:hypothetical protein